MLDFVPENHASDTRGKSYKLADSGCPIPNVVVRDFKTTAAVHNQTAWDPQIQEKSRRVVAGVANTQLPGYNIITGGAPLSNNFRFESYERQDMRRTR